MSEAVIDFQMRRRPSGLLVPPNLASMPEGPAPAPTGARDADGRRRVLVSDESRRLMWRLVRELGQCDLAFVTVCQTSRRVVRHVTNVATGQLEAAIVTEPIAGACGQLMLREGEGTADPGFGCACTRLHFLPAT